jgi:hypothetical protein
MNLRVTFFCLYALHPDVLYCYTVFCILTPCTLTGNKVSVERIASIFSVEPLPTQALWSKVITNIPRIFWLCNIQNFPNPSSMLDPNISIKSSFRTILLHDLLYAVLKKGKSIPVTGREGP